MRKCELDQNMLHDTYKLIRIKKSKNLQLLSPARLHFKSKGEIKTFHKRKQLVTIKPVSQNIAIQNLQTEKENACNHKNLRTNNSH